MSGGDYGDTCSAVNELLISSNQSAVDQVEPTATD
eukprot:SAG31_NODE_57_length_29727_cov_12.584568_2_plen_35_part_00